MTVGFGLLRVDLLRALLRLMDSPLVSDETALCREARGTPALISLVRPRIADGEELLNELVFWSPGGTERLSGLSTFCKRGTVMFGVRVRGEKEGYTTHYASQPRDARTSLLVSRRDSAFIRAFQLL